MSSGQWTLLASLIGVLGLFLYGFLAWFFKRLITQLDEMTKVTRLLHSKVTGIDIRLQFLENKAKTDGIHVQAHVSNENTED